LILLVLFVITTITVFSDGSFFRMIDPLGAYTIRSDMQRAAILYNETSDRERLILQIALNSELDEVGWIIALPSMPDMYEWEHDEIFPFLNEMTNKVIEEENKPRPGCMGLPGGCVAEGNGGLYFFETISVGQLDLTPIQAVNAQALVTWLRNNEVSFENINEAISTELEEIFTQYIDRNWIFIYGKFNIQPDYYGSTQLLTFDFNSDMPFYPMLLTKIQQKMFSQAYLNVRLWLITDELYRIIAMEDGQPTEYNDYVRFNHHLRFSFEPDLDLQSVLGLSGHETKNVLFLSLDYIDHKAFEDIWFQLQ